MIVKFIKTTIGLFRVLAFLEGLSLLILLFVAMPLKYWYDQPIYVEKIGMIHGILFLLFVVATIFLHFDQQWNFLKRTWAVLLSSFIPFGTFYIDYRILKHIKQKR